MNNSGMKIQLKFFEKVIIAVVLLLWLTVSIGTLIEKPIDQTNTTIVKATLG
jgi:hypothetical protein